MYMFIESWILEGNHHFDDLDKANQYLQMKAKDGGFGWKGALVKVEKVAANEIAQLQYAELSAEDFFAKVEEKKRQYKALGIDVDEEAY